MSRYFGDFEYLDLHPLVCNKGKIKCYAGTTEEHTLYAVINEDVMKLYYRRKGDGRKRPVRVYQGDVDEILAG